MLCCEAFITTAVDLLIQLQHFVVALQRSSFTTSNESNGAAARCKFKSAKVAMQPVACISGLHHEVKSQMLSLTFTWSAFLMQPMVTSLSTARRINDCWSLLESRAQYLDSNQLVQHNVSILRSVGVATQLSWTTQDCLHVLISVALPRVTPMVPM